MNTVDVNTIEQLLRWAAAQLAGGDSPKLDAEVLLCHLLQKDRSYLFTWNDKVVSGADITAFQALVKRRAAGEPVAHIIGYREFWSLPLEVSADTLIPRPDTERLVELALERLPDGPCSVLDLGTGTGAIALALASERTDAEVSAIEYQHAAADLARRNSSRCGIPISVLQGSWYEPLADSGKTFDVIVSNPPYIDAADPHLVRGDVRFEPSSALVAEDEGLADLAHIIEQGTAYLKTGGWLLVEHGFTQGEAVRAIFADADYTHVVTYKDYGNNDRVTVGQKLRPNEEE